MEDLFDTIMGTGRKKRRVQTARRKLGASAAGEALREALGGSADDETGGGGRGDAAWYDLDHAGAAGTRSESRVLTDDDFSYEPGPLEIERDGLGPSRDRPSEDFGDDD